MKNDWQKEEKISLSLVSSGVLETECSDWLEDTSDWDGYEPNGEILSSVAMATIWRRGICCSSCLCALNSGEVFFYYSWMKENLIWRREPLPSHWNLKNQVKSFKFERYFLDLINLYSSNFSEDWIRIRNHLKTNMSIADIKRCQWVFLEVHLWLVERTCGRELWLMENYVRSSRWLLIRASSGWRRQKEYESKIPDLIFTHAVFPPGYHGDPCWFVVRGDSLCWLNQEQPLQEVQHVYFRPAAGQPLTRKTGRSWWPRIT